MRKSASAERCACVGCRVSAKYGPADLCSATSLFSTNSAGNRCWLPPQNCSVPAHTWHRFLELRVGATR